ncbi:MAG: YdcH family protein [Parvularculaceae bacterium]
MRLALLLQEHSDLDAAILALATAPSHDSIALARLKKKKLQLKDMIQKLRDQMTPDIIA